MWNKKYLTIFHSLWSIGIVLFVYFGLGEFKILPMFAVIFMAAGVHYSIYKYLRDSPSHQQSIELMDIDKFENSYRIAKPLRIIGLALSILQAFISLNLLTFKYDSFIIYLALLFLMVYIFLAFFYYRNQQFDRG